MRAWLHKNGLEVEERDFFQNRFTKDELLQLIGATPPREIFSWNSPSFKKLDLPADSLGDNDLIKLMISEPRLIRRPLIKIDDKLIIGSALKNLDASFRNA